MGSFDCGLRGGGHGLGRFGADRLQRCINGRVCFAVFHGVVHQADDDILRALKPVYVHEQTLIRADRFALVVILEATKK